MSNTRKRIVAAALAAVTAISLSTMALASNEDENRQPGEEMMSKEQIIDKALADYPGEVTKAYLEKKRGKDVWEIEIKGDDGKKWETYYDAMNGELVKADAE